MDLALWFPLIGGAISVIGFMIMLYDRKAHPRTAWSARSMIDQRNSPPLSSQFYLFNEGIHDTYATEFFLSNGKWAIKTKMGDLKAHDHGQLPMVTGDWSDHHMMVRYRSKDDRAMIGKVNSPGLLRFLPARIGWWWMRWVLRKFTIYNRKWFEEHDPLGLGS